MKDALQVTFDTAVCALDAIQRALFRYTADYYTDIRVSGPVAIVELRTKTAAPIADRLTDELRNDVLDEVLRARVRAESGSIHAELIRAALQSAVAPKAPQ